VRLHLFLTATLLAVAPLAGASAQKPTQSFVCSTLRADLWHVPATPPVLPLYRWTVSSTAARPPEEIDRKEVQAYEPTFDCLDNTMMLVRSDTISGHIFLDIAFPTGDVVTVDEAYAPRPDGRFVLPMQTKPEIPEEYRDRFLYHCLVSWEPLPAGTSAADCIKP
jgi:hypothetical protein